jgi:hypothetical protein
MFTINRMSTATVSALALICLLTFFIVESWPKNSMSFMDLQEFKELPTELRAVVRNMLPNSAVLKKQWATMSPQQRQAVIQQIMASIPSVQQQPQNVPKAPSSFVKHVPKPVPEVVVPDEQVIEEVPEVVPEEVVPEKVPEETPKKKGMKAGFLLSERVDKGKKKASKNKKENQVITLSDVGASDADGDGVASGDDE